jgi:dGTPase
MLKEPDRFRHRLREDAEKLEDETLAPGATRAAASRGRRVREIPDRHRTAFERDRDRILHTKAFRRLKHKTQVFINPEGDHYVTRLTHTLNVVQVGRSIARYLSLNETLTEAICLGHDVGHSPFGHTGEEALSGYVTGEWLHSEQGVRVFDTLEPQNLSWEVLDGIRAHSWKIATGPSTPEGLVCRYADRIAYLAHDVEDAMRAGVLGYEDLPERSIASFGEPGRQWIGSMIDAVVSESLAAGRVAMATAALEAMLELREFMFDRVYLRPEVADERRKAIGIVRDLVDYFVANPAELPDSYVHEDTDHITSVIDYVSGMTDRFALRMHDDLYRPRLF